MQTSLNQTKGTGLIPLGPETDTEEAAPTFVNDVPKVDPTDGATPIFVGDVPNVVPTEEVITPAISSESDQEVRTSVERPVDAVADIAVEILPTAPATVKHPGYADQAECRIVSGSTDADPLVRYKAAISDLLNTLSTIAGSVARPSEELSAMAQFAVNRYAGKF